MDLFEFGRRMQIIREEVLQINQADLAEKIGTVQTLVSRMERGIGGNINTLFDFITFLEKEGYPTHYVFKKEFEVEFLKKKELNKIVDKFITGILRSYSLTK